MNKMIRVRGRVLLLIFAIAAVVVCGSIQIKREPKLNGDQYSWRIEGIMERISEKEDELQELYDEYWEALQTQRELYAQEATE